MDKFADESILCVTLSGTYCMTCAAGSASTSRSMHAVPGPTAQIGAASTRLVPCLPREVAPRFTQLCPCLSCEPAPHAWETTSKPRFKLRLCAAVSASTSTMSDASCTAGSTPRIGAALHSYARAYFKNRRRAPHSELASVSRAPRVCAAMAVPADDATSLTIVYHGEPGYFGPNLTHSKFYRKSP
jgi:hypothetical protein